MVRVRRKLLFLLSGIMVIAVAGILLFSVIPVPFSAVMAERQAGALLSGNLSYRARSSWVSMADISPWMPLAVIAGEDQKFPNHWGFYFGALQSVLDSSGRGSMRGASTLSQQTAKNLFLWDGRSWVRKGLEAILTAGIETVWSKKRILTVYLNIAEFGPGIFGVEAASQAYFHKPASQLTRQQAALLAAVLPNPIVYHVSAPSAYPRERQQWISQQMGQLGGLEFLNKYHLY
ncbi:MULTISPECIES: monofunctional biosynthetic peptidoglycan transglycosylase [unclassified Tatumella]|uniref:monofunctional biosynthetic peptidoglycan transglycosylase n=1 Tax=unclassified Tatumella TaxID=2649542 RepID=UPI001BAEA202|nr:MULTISPECIES: monofunctional biosynthetic peptidoglycan transglycosylase [unclassified Tatumella]MBS0856445.1 monofunctional biosynthetic peptidoglycan transglycosylase [Tatumella sp. JGM16]MBS0912595.1 monofunctional biosynthetic peptidoglycan transglycosylase [Tatumella sp. JGM91]